MSQDTSDIPNMKYDGKNELNMSELIIKKTLFSETTLKVYCLFESLGSEMTGGGDACLFLFFFSFSNISTSSPPFTLTPDSRQVNVHPDFAPTRLISPSVLMDLGRSKGKPRARLHTSWDSTPRARDTPNSTV